MNRCPQCAAEQPAQARFCGECGTPLPAAAPAAVAPSAAAATVNGSPQPAANGFAAQVPPATVPPQAAPDSSATPGWGSAGVPAQPQPEYPQAQYPQAQYPQAQPAGEVLAGPGGQGPRWSEPGPGAQPAAVGSVMASARSSLTLTQDAVKRAATDGLLALAAQLVLLTVLVASLGVLAASGHHGSPVDWVRSAVILAALAMHGSADLHASGSAGAGLFGSASGEGHVSVTVQLLTLTFTGMLAVAVLARRREQQHPSGTLAHATSAAGVNAGVYACALALLGVISRGELGFGLDSALSDGADGASVSASVTLGTGFVSTLLGAALLTFAASLGGRWLVLRRSHDTAATLRGFVPTWLNGWGRPGASALASFTAALAAGAVATTLYVGYLLVQQARDGSSIGGVTHAATVSTGGGVAAFVFGAIVFLAVLPSLVVYALGAAMGATLGVSSTASGAAGADGGLFGSDSGSYQHGVGLLAGHVPATLWLTVLIPLVAALVAGVRGGMARDPREQSWAPWWRYGLTYAALWLVLALAVGVRVHADASLGGSVLGSSGNGQAAVAGTAGLGIPSTLLVGFAWGVATFAFGRLLSRWVAGALPRTATVLAGRSVHPLWAGLLAELHVRSGRQVSPRLAARAAQAEPPAEPLAPLHAYARAGRWLLAGAGALVVLGGAGAFGVHEFSTRVVGPQATVAAFYDAVESGDAAGALAQLQPTNDDGTDLDRTLLTADVLAKEKAAGGIAGIHVYDTEVAGNEAIARVTLSGTGGWGANTPLTLVKDDQHKKFGLFTTWKLDTKVLTPLLVHDDRGTVSVDGVPVAAEKAYPTFPGLLSVHADGGKFYTSADQTGDTRYSGTDTVEVSLSSTVSGAAQQAIVDQVTSQMQDCMRSASPAPEGCPFSDGADWSNQTGQWAETSAPAVSDVTDNGDGTMAFTVTGALTFHWTDPGDGFTSPSAQDDQVPLDITGTAQIQGDQIVITQW